jgi:hypothetical protein
MHGLFALAALIEESRNRSERILPRAFQLEEDAEKLNRELRRRETTNQLLRTAFERLNIQSCEIEYNPAADAWCLGGFSKGLLPILEPFLEQLDSTLGVRGPRYSVEVYFQQGTVPVDGCRNDCHRNLSQLAFYSPHVGNCQAVQMESKCSPAKIGYEAGKAFEQHIENNKQLFFENGKPLEAIYFRRYATCPISENCGERAEGVLVLTSMQDEQFADDVLDTLAFLSTIVSSYLAAYRRCYEKHKSKTPQGRLPVQHSLPHTTPPPPPK